MRNLQEILNLYETLKTKYKERNSDFKILRAAYEGRYWEGAETEGITLIYNLLNSAVHRYVDYLATLPDIRVIPPGLEVKDQEFADTLEKVLYGIWDENLLDIKLQQMVFYQALLGLIVIHTRPDPDSPAKIIHEIGVPEYFYPLPKKDDFTKLEAVIYASPDLTLETHEHPMEYSSDEVVQYWDAEGVVYIKDSQIQKTIRHNFGFVPWTYAQNRIRPHRVHGSSDLEQAVGLMDYLNTLFSYKADIIEWAADPPMILKGSNLAPQDVPRGPHSVIPIEQEADIKFLQWTGSPPDIDNQISLTQKAIQDMLGLAEPAWGRHLPSGVSGATVREFMSGPAARISAKQLLIGRALVEANAMSLRIAEKVYPNEELVYCGIKRGQAFSVRLKGKDIKGHTRNRVIWKPGGLDASAKVNNELQKMGARVQSRITTMENLGIEQPLDENKRIRDDILEERQREAPLSPGVKPGMEGKVPEGAESPEVNEAEEKKILEALLKEEAGKVGKTGKEKGVPEEEIESEGEGRITLSEVVKALQAVRKLTGEVWLIGEIVTQGWTEGNIDVALTDLKDKATILNALPQFRGRINFSKVTGQPEGEARKIRGEKKE